MNQFIQTLLFFLLFIPISASVLFVPGFGILSGKRKELEDAEIITLSLALSIVIFAGFSFLLAAVNLRNMMLPLIMLVNFFIVLKYKLEILRPFKVFIKNKVLLFLMAAGILTMGLINFPSGYLYQDGLYFWSSQGHDGLWHVASMEAIKKAIPPQNPGFAGEPIVNYHYLADVLMGEFLRIFPFFSSLDLYFRFFPVVFSFLIGISVFSFVSRWQKNAGIGLLAVFFTYFTGSFGYIVTFIKNGNLFGGETVFWAAQQNTLLGNPPHAISHGLLASFFLSFIIYLKERSFIWMLIVFLTGAILAGFKVSGGFTMLMGLGAASLIDFIYRRKLQTLILAFALGVSNLLTFKFMTSNGSSFLMFLPWWFVRTMIVDKIGWIDLELRRQHYLSKGTFTAYLRVIELESIAFVIFLFGNLGMRILGIFELVRRIIATKGSFLKEPVNVMLIVTMLTGLFIPLLFVQKGLIYNNIQFMQYTLFVFGFYGAVFTYKLLSGIRSKLFKFITFGLIILFSVPTVFGNLIELYGPQRMPLSKITRSEIAALEYLKENSDGNEKILTVPFNEKLKEEYKFQPWPIFAWYDTPYVSALTGRDSYLASEHVRLLFYSKTQERVENKKKFFSQEDIVWNRQFLRDEGINYIYTAKAELKDPLNIIENNLEIFFENSETIIYKVKAV